MLIGWFEKSGQLVQAPRTGDISSDAVRRSAVPVSFSSQSHTFTRLARGLTLEYVGDLDAVVLKMLFHVSDRTCAREDEDRRLCLGRGRRVTAAGGPGCYY